METIEALQPDKGVVNPPPRLGGYKYKIHLLEVALAALHKELQKAKTENNQFRGLLKKAYYGLGLLTVHLPRVLNTELTKDAFNLKEIKIVDLKDATSQDQAEAIIMSQVIFLEGLRVIRDREMNLEKMLGDTQKMALEVAFQGPVLAESPILRSYDMLTKALDDLKNEGKLEKDAILADRDDYQSSNDSDSEDNSGDPGGEGLSGDNKDHTTGGSQKPASHPTSSLRAPAHTVVTPPSTPKEKTPRPSLAKNSSDKKKKTAMK